MMNDGILSFYFSIEKFHFLTTNIIHFKINCLYISQNTFLEMKFDSIP